MTDPAAPAAPAPPSRRWLLLHVALPLGAVAAIWLLRDVLAPIVAALFLAYALSPAVDWLERHRIPRGLGTFLVLFLALGTIVGVIVCVLPAILGEFQRFIHKLPALLEEFTVRTIPSIERTFDIDLPDDFGTALERLAVEVRKLPPETVAPLGKIVAGVLQGAASFFSALFTVLLVPILTYFFLRDFRQLAAGARREIPARVRPAMEAYLGEVDAIMSSYLRGQLLVMVCLALLYGLGLWAIGLRLGLAIGLLAGVLAFIPYAGFAIGLTLALLMALVTFETGWTYVGIVAVFTGAQVLEALVLTPLLVGRRVGLGMVWVLIAILVFGATLGFVGVLLAVPLGAIFRVSFRRLLAYRAAVDREGAGGDGKPETGGPKPDAAPPAPKPAGDAT